MRQRILIGTSILAVLLMAPLPTLAQLPGGVQVPGSGSLPTGVPSPPEVPSKDALLQRAKGVVSDLTAMKSSGKLAPAQVQQVDGLLPKATALTSALQKPQIPASKLPEYATTLSDLQRQVGTLKSAIK
jgi:hypothetical protein